MTASIISPVLSAFTSYDDRLNTFCFLGGGWSSASRRPQVAEALFPGIVKVSNIVIPYAGSDMTVDRARIVVRLRTPDGGYTDLEEFREATIGRGYETPEGQVDFSNDFPSEHPSFRPLKVGWKLKRNALKPLMLEAADGMEAIALQIFMEGHGWFALRGVEVYGEILKPLTSLQIRELKDDYATDLKVVER